MVLNNPYSRVISHTRIHFGRCFECGPGMLSRFGNLSECPTDEGMGRMPAEPINMPYGP